MVTSEFLAMFRVQKAGRSPLLFATMSAVLLAIMAAMITTVWLAVEVRKEQRAIAELTRSGPPNVDEIVGTLPSEMRWQFILSIAVLVILIAAAMALAFMLRAYLRTQASLRELKSFSWDILASMDQGVLTTDRQQRITSSNPRAHALLGIAHDCVGQFLESICNDELPLDRLSVDVLNTERASLDNHFATSQNGQPLRLRAECHVLTDADERVLGTVLHLRDVTDRVLIEDRLKRMERFMGLGQLAAGLHHEIKNPLGALSLHVQLLEENLDGRADDEVAENLSVLKTEIVRINGVLESFRDYTALDHLKRSPTDLGELVEQTARLVRPQAEQRSVRIGLPEINADLHSVDVDAAKLEQVLLNLMLNALEAMPEGGELRLALACGDGELQLKVSDTGKGIPESLRSRVFDPYFTTKSDGSGMGLALCEKIVQQHDGTIKFQTSTSGTVFQITLPADAAS